MPLNKEKIEEKAIAAGHVVHGKLVDAREVLGEGFGEFSANSL